MPNLVLLPQKINLKLFVFFFLLLVLALALSSCRRTSPYAADISKVETEPVEIKRYEEVLFEVDPLHLREEIDPHIDDFYLFLGEEINTEAGQQQLYDYISDPFTREIYHDVKEEWTDLSGLEQQLTLAFRYLKYHFPQVSVPEVYSYVSGLNFEYPVIYQDDVLIIGLDMFLGRDYSNYERVRVPAFKRVRFVPEAAPVEAMREIGKVILSGSSYRPETLLDNMIYEGKILYFLDAMLPAFSDARKIYFTQEQIEWAEANEGPSWTFIINNEMLYTADRQLIQKFTGDAPFTAPFSNQSSPRMGNYIGWQIVREYMRRNKDVSLMELLYEKNDARELLSNSRYRP